MKRVPNLFLSKRYVMFFIVSHILGWVLANIQTIWIVWETRKQTRILREEIQKIKARD